MMSQGQDYRPPERQDYFDILKNLPTLPEGARPHESCTRDNPIAVDMRTGDLYHIREGKWILGDKQ